MLISILMLITVLIHYGERHHNFIMLINTHKAVRSHTMMQQMTQRGDQDQWNHHDGPNMIGCITVEPRSLDA